MFSGRIRRRTFWIGQISLLGLTWVTGFAAGVVLVPLMGALRLDADSLRRVLEVVTFVAGLLLAAWSAALYARRLHDVGLPALLAVFPVALGLLTGAAELAREWGRDVRPFYSSATVALLAAGLLVWGIAAFWPGKPRPNRYGDPPPQPR